MIYARPLSSHSRLALVQRVNAERKRRQMVLLQESVHFIKMAHNERSV